MIKEFENLMVLSRRIEITMFILAQLLIKALSNFQIIKFSN